jgi:hypothetical protein
MFGSTGSLSGEQPASNELEIKAFIQIRGWLREFTPTFPEGRKTRSF